MIRLRNLVTAAVETVYLKSWARRNKMRLLGSGNQGSGWALPNGNVLKVMFKPNSAEYLHFVELARKTRSRHFPKIFSVRDVPFSEVHTTPGDTPPPAKLGHYVFVEVERLEPIPKKFDVIGTRTKSFRAALVALEDYARTHNLRMDLGTQDNIMLRGDVQVFTDPFSPR